MNITLGILLGLGAMVGFGLSDAISQIPSRRLGPIKAIFYRNIIVSAILLVVLLFTLSQAQFTFAGLKLAVLISILGYFPLLIFYKALRVGKVGVVVPIANSATIVTVILSIFILHEALAANQLLGISLTIIGVILISIRFQDFKNSQIFSLSSGVPFALLTMLLWGIVFFLFNYPANILGPVLAIFINEAGMTLMAGAHLLLKKESFAVSDKTAWPALLAVGITGAMAGIFLFWGFTIADVSIVAALAFSGPFISVLYGRFVFKEHLSKQQWLAVAIIILGIISVSVN